MVAPDDCMTACLFIHALTFDCTNTFDCSLRRSRAETVDDALMRDPLPLTWEGDPSGLQALAQGVDLVGELVGLDLDHEEMLDIGMLGSSPSPPPPLLLPSGAEFQTGCSRPGGANDGSADGSSDGSAQAPVQRGSLKRSAPMSQWGSSPAPTAALPKAKSAPALSALYDLQGGVDDLIGGMDGDLLDAPLSPPVRSHKRSASAGNLERLARHSTNAAAAAAETFSFAAAAAAAAASVPAVPVLPPLAGPGDLTFEHSAALSGLGAALGHSTSWSDLSRMNLHSVAAAPPCSEWPVEEATASARSGGRGGGRGGGGGGGRGGGGGAGGGGGWRSDSAAVSRSCPGESTVEKYCEVVSEEERRRRRLARNRASARLRRLRKKVSGRTPDDRIGLWHSAARSARAPKAGWRPRSRVALQL